MSRGVVQVEYSSPSTRTYLLHCLTLRVTVKNGSGGDFSFDVDKLDNNLNFILINLIISILYFKLDEIPRQRGHRRKNTENRPQIDSLVTPNPARKWS